MEGGGVKHFECKINRELFALVIFWSGLTFTRKTPPFPLYITDQKSVPDIVPILIFCILREFDIT